MQRTEQFRPGPTIASLDFTDHIRQAYWNCVNALQQFQSEQVGVGDVSRFEAKVAWERFDGCVRILTQMILPEWIDEEFKKEIGPDTKIEPREVRIPEDRFDRSTWGGRSTRTEYIEIPEEKSKLEIFGAITRLFNRIHIFKVQIAYGGHL